MRDNDDAPQVMEPGDGPPSHPAALPPGAVLVASMLAGVAGILHGVLAKKIGPEVMGVNYTVDALLMTIIGGAGTFAGPVLGAASLELADTVFRDAIINIGGLSINIGERWTLILGLIFAFVVRRWRTQRQDATGQPARVLQFTAGIMLAALVIGWLISGTPFTVNFPELRGPNVQDGIVFSTGFISLVVGLTLYTAAFVADIVRAGIQSVPYGQIEAARSQGFSGGQVLSLIVLPQALRLIIPPLGNQYVNLGKNSSLGLVVGFVDTYRIGQLANNESGQAVPIFVGLMVIYLILSLVISVLTNLINRGTRFKTR